MNRQISPQTEYLLSLLQRENLVLQRTQGWPKLPCSWAEWTWHLNGSMALKTGLETWLGRSWLLPLEGQGVQQGRLQFHCSEWSKGIFEISKRARRVYTPGNVEQEDRGHFRQIVNSVWHSRWHSEGMTFCIWWTWSLSCQRAIPQSHGELARPSSGQAQNG